MPQVTNMPTHIYTWSILTICIMIESILKWLPGFPIRREVYRILQEEGIDLPRYAVLNRDPDNPEGES